MNNSYIYVLFRADGRPFYVGKGTGTRWIKHEEQARRDTAKVVNRHLRAVIRQMFADGFNEIPKIKLHEGLSDATASAYEIALIAAIGRRPHGPLVNFTVGGEGCPGLPAEVLAKRGRLISAALTGRKMPPGHGAKVAAGHRGRKCTEEQKENMRRAQRARTVWPSLSDDHKRKVSESSKGRTHTMSDESKVKLSESLRASPAFQAAMAEVNARKKGVPLSENHKERLSASTKGKPKSAEHKEKQRIAALARWARERAEREQGANILQQALEV